MVTVMEVEVDELWSKTVTRTPIMSPHIGLSNRDWLVRAAPATRPVSNKDTYN